MINQVPPIHPSWRRIVTTAIFFFFQKKMFLDVLILTRNYRLIEPIECHPGFFSRPSELLFHNTVFFILLQCKDLPPGEGARRTSGHHLWDFCSSIQAGSLDWQLFYIRTEIHYISLIKQMLPMPGGWKERKKMTKAGRLAQLADKVLTAQA